jgi:hypothetical protein
MKYRSYFPASVRVMKKLSLFTLLTIGTTALAQPEIDIVNPAQTKY